MNTAELPPLHDSTERCSEVAWESVRAPRSAPSAAAGPCGLLPLLDAREHLSLQLQRVGTCLERYRCQREPLPIDAAGRFARATCRLSELDSELRARLRISARSCLPLAQLQHRFALSELAIQFLVAAAAPGLDLDLGRQLAELTEDGSQQVNVGFLLMLLTEDADERRMLLAELSETAPLVAHRLVRLGTPRGWVPTGPILLSPVVVPERILAWMCGQTHFEGRRFNHSTRLRYRVEGIRPSAQTLAAVTRALFRPTPGGHPATVLAGPTLSGKSTVVIASAAQQNRLVLEVDLEQLVSIPDSVELMPDIVREACLHEAVLLLRHAEVLDERRAALRREIAAVLLDGRVCVALTTRGEPAELLRMAPDMQLVRITLPTESEQLQLWESELAASRPCPVDLDPRALVRRYSLAPGDIRAAAAAGVLSAARRAPGAAITLEDMSTAIRERLRSRLKDIAEVITPKQSWCDIVLPDAISERIAELLAAVLYEERVMDDWGFGARVSYGRTISALFSGPPGTGKTMIAGLLAKELGLELFRVDLSRVISKWVGETEKNLSLLFDEASNARAILLFDEADALFGKRTEIRSSNDRYANLETNYLLQRIEAFDGIVLLTTNREPQMDEAFRRRIRFRIEFPMPDEHERAEIWRSLMPPAAPLAVDVDFDALGARYEMTGGYIKKAVLRAAFMAAVSREQVITNQMLNHAATLEWEEMGKLT
jgi:hypothetical protein